MQVSTIIFFYMFLLPHAGQFRGSAGPLSVRILRYLRYYHVCLIYFYFISYAKLQLSDYTEIVHQSTAHSSTLKLPARIWRWDLSILFSETFHSISLRRVVFIHPSRLNAVESLETWPCCPNDSPYAISSYISTSPSSGTADSLFFKRATSSSIFPASVSVFHCFNP